MKFTKQIIPVIKMKIQTNKIEGPIWTKITQLDRVLFSLAVLRLRIKTEPYWKRKYEISVLSGQMSKSIFGWALDVAHIDDQDDLDIRQESEFFILKYFFALVIFHHISSPRFDLNSTCCIYMEDWQEVEINCQTIFLQLLQVRERERTPFHFDTFKYSPHLRFP